MKLPDGKYAVIHADAAWMFKAGTKSRPQHYKRMTLDEIKAMPVAALAEKDCWLFFWTTGPHLEQAFEVLKAWGFKYSAMGFVWVKLNKNAGGLFFLLRDIFMGHGYTTRHNAEFCLLAKRGKPKRLSKKVHEIILAPRREHSRKPDEVFDRIEEYTSGPYLELFSRKSRPGWQHWGDESGKFDYPGDCL